MCPKSTSRLHFRNIAHSPEPVPPLTVFLQVSAPNLIAGSSTFEEFFSLFLINSLTDGPPIKCGYSFFMFTAARVSPVGEREQAEAPQAGDPLFWVEISWVPGTGWCIGTKEYRLKTDMEGGADSKVMKIAVFIWDTLQWEYFLVKCGCHSVSSNSYHRAPNCILLHKTQRVYVICSVQRQFHERSTTDVESRLELKS